MAVELAVQDFPRRTSLFSIKKKEKEHAVVLLVGSRACGGVARCRAFGHKQEQSGVPGLLGVIGLSYKVASTYYATRCSEVGIARNEESADELNAYVEMVAHEIWQFAA